MKILALETSTAAGSIALLESGKLIAHVALPAAQRFAQSLAPAVSSQLAEAGWKARQLDLVATTRGPGSFTGIRLAVTTSKMLAYATGAQVIGLSTLEVIANQTPSSIATVEVLLDAQRGQLYVGRYRRDESGHMQPEQQARIQDIACWLQNLTSDVPITGPALAKLDERWSKEVLCVAPELWIPQAKTVGQLALDYYQAGRRDDLWQLVPEYHRKSAAEEKRAGERASG